ncbi:hypothetical protein [Agriterribacter sp.]|uniref:hypothetical protein n=1 Tax=Agriterribacter sp. TaxID=2821509 RepID=UPI002BE775F0|nr:hypothetical protein [Agriterribacter sp.]HTN05991.1 hypothetical protein [Agriterribacter sp.]
MKIKIMLPLFAVIAAIALTFVVSSFQKGINEKNPKGSQPTLIDYYFKFDGTDGEETNEMKWTETDAADFNSTLTCTSIRRGCKLKTTKITGTSGVDAHPELVEVDGTAPNISPKTSVASGVTQVKNRVPTY